jgi:hypothetical protein
VRGRADPFAIHVERVTAPPEDEKRKTFPRFVVTVRNPYGQYFRPRREPHGLRNGFLTHGGIFHVPLRDFVRIFNSVTYETGQPLQ